MYCLSSESVADMKDYFLTVQLQYKCDKCGEHIINSTVHTSPTQVCRGLVGYCAPPRMSLAAAYTCTTAAPFSPQPVPVMHAGLRSVRTLLQGGARRA